MANTVLIFDIDGTLTHSRRAMEAGFARVFRDVTRRHRSYLVTGSDRAKVAQQIPSDILGLVEGVYTCSGNELWRGDRAVFSMRHDFADAMIASVQAMIAECAYPVRTGRHVETRAGTLNVSVVGRNANALQRKDYQRHDQATGERGRLIRQIRARFPGYDAFRGGQISIDVSPKGWNKSRVAAEVASRHAGAAVHFFADNLGGDGNDLPLALALRADGPRNRIHSVRDCSETLAILQSQYRVTVRPASAA